MGSVFGHLARDPAQDVNTQLIASENPVGADGLRSSAAALPAALRDTADATAARLAAPLRGGRVYTDDVAPVEWLIDASIVEVAADGER
jgi:hypothetical protein